MRNHDMPRRILMTADTIGGVWTYALELARALEPCGIEVLLATMGRALTDEQWAACRVIDNLTVCESGYRLEWMDDPWRDVALAGDWLLELEQQFQPDVIHVNGFVHAALGWHSPVLAVAHSCVMSWWAAVKGEAAPAQWDTYARLVRRGLHHADRVAAPSYAMLEALRVHYGPLADAVVIPNGRNALKFRPGRKEPLVFTAGRLWDEAKNVALVESAAPALPWPVLVAGEEQHPDGGSVHPENVRRLGRLAPDVLADWLSRASIYTLPACYEPFGLSVLEAALAGCALVLGDIASLRENWDGAALFVPPHDAGALREALCALTADDALRSKLARRAQERARLFTPERMVAGYLALYREMAAQHKSRAQVQ